MKQPLRRLNPLLLLFLIPGMQLRASAQISAVATADVRPTPTVLIEARVIGIPASEFRNLGVIFPESADVSDGPLGFAVVLPETEAQALLKHPRTTNVHNLKLQGAPGSTLKFRVDSRVPANGNGSIGSSQFYEVGMMFEVAPEVFSGRRIALSASSFTQVRRSQEAGAGLAPVVFQTEPIRHNIQIPEGKTIVLGGFLTTANSGGLPAISAVTGNPLLGYIASRSPRKGEEPEIVVLLTPRALGAVDAAPPAPVFSPIPPASNPVTKSEPVALAPAAPASIPVPSAVPNPVFNTVPKPDVPALSAANSPAAAARPTPPVTPSRKPAPKTNVRFYTVQVGAFSSSVNADALAMDLKKNFEGVFVDEAPDGPTPYRVRVGRLSTQAAAKRIQSKLKVHGFDGFVVTPDSR